MIEKAIVNTSRRHFLKTSAAAGAGLTLGVYFPQLVAEQAAGPGKTGSSMAQGGVFEPNAFVRIGTDNSVSVSVKHLEMGQGTYTGLSTLVAEELDADWSQIRAQGAPADAARYNNLFWGQSQGTGGSTAIANSFEQMRKAGAAARQMLAGAAAQKWAVPASEITIKKGVVAHPSTDRQTTFGELAEAAAKQPVPENVRLKDPKDFVYIGTVLSRKDPGKTNGTAIFTQDVKLPGLLTAMVAHPPRFGGKVKSYDANRAKAVKGVEAVVQIPSGVAVLATDFWSAKSGRDLLEIEWDETQAIKLGSREIMSQYKALVDKPGKVARQDGNVGKALSAATKVIQADYEFPYLAHATMEPMNCVVALDSNGCEIWNGAQLQTADQSAVAAALGLKPEQVKINMLYAGGSFGRRANPHSDYVVEAAAVAKAIRGRAPVKLVWTREDDTRAGYFRPLYFHRIKGGVDAQGKLVAWQQHIVGQSIIQGTAFEKFLVKDGIDQTSVEGAANLPYAIPNFTLDLHTTDIPVPVQWWRAVGSTHTAFSTETFMDELAAAADKDPVAFRLGLLSEHPRHLGVLKLAAEKADWGSPLPQGRARGIAVHESFNSYVAQVAEVTVKDDASYSVDRVVCAVDCGLPVNPDVIRAQMEGGIGYGLSAVLTSEITLEQGRVQQSNFHDYEVLRINQMPEIEVHILPSTEAPTGVGEPGTPVIAPAVANALYAATGQRLYRLPLRLSPNDLDKV